MFNNQLKSKGFEDCFIEFIKILHDCKSLQAQSSDQKFDTISLGIQWWVHNFMKIN